MLPSIYLQLALACLFAFYGGSVGSILFVIIVAEALIRYPRPVGNLVFTYGVSFLARRQIEEKEHAETALRELERSRPGFS